MRLVDADALIAQIEENICKPCIERKEDYHRVRCRACQYGDEINDIDSAPTIERKKGKWIEVEVFPDSYDIYGNKTWSSEMQCDQCGFRHTAIEGHIAQYNYCPNCGADMRGEQNEL